MNVTIPTVLTRREVKILTYTVTLIYDTPYAKVWRVETNDGLMMGDCYDLLERQAYESVLLRHGYRPVSLERSK